MTWVDQDSFAARMASELNGVSKKYQEWKVDCSSCPEEQSKRKQARIFKGSSNRWMLQCPVCSSAGRKETAGMSLSRLIENHGGIVKDDWNDAWRRQCQSKTKSTYQQPLPIKNRRTDERTEYKKRSWKEKQAVKSLALEFLQNGSGQ